MLKKRGIPEDHIIFLNVVAAPEGIECVFKKYPEVRIVTCALDECLNEAKYIVPVSSLVYSLKYRVLEIMAIVILTRYRLCLFVLSIRSVAKVLQFY